MDNKIKFVWTTINFKTGLLDPNNLTWEECTLNEIFKRVQDSKKGDTSICALVYPKDIEGKGSPVDSEVSYEKYKEDPCTYGVSIFKTWNNKICVE